MPDQTKILIIHDTDQHPMRLQADLHDAGYQQEASITSSIDEALVSLKQGSYDLLITDIHFEQASEIVSTLNQIIRVHRAPVIFIIEKPDRFNHVVLPLKVKYAFLPVDAEPLMLGQTIGLLLENHELTNYTRSSDQISDAYEQQVAELLALLEHHNDGVIIFDEGRVVRYMNDTARNLFESGLNEVVQNCHEIAQGLEPMRLIEFEQEGEGPLWLDIQCMPMTWGSNPVTISFIRDVTRRRQLEDELIQARRMEGLGSLAGGIAHDFNNILMAIAGYAELVKEGAPDQPDLQEDIAAVNASVDRASILTRKLLAFGRQSNMRDRLKVGEVIEGMESLLRTTLGEQVALELEANDTPGNILADRHALEQVILNIAQNARDAMPEGGTFKVSIHLVNLGQAGRTDNKGKFIQIRLSDSGPGIPSELHDRIFDPFFTTKARHEGAGLGLSTVYAHVQRMGGHILVDKEGVTGTTMLINIPPSTGESTTATSDAPREDAPVTTIQGQRILLVEDESAIRKILSRKLTGIGFEVLQAGDAAHAMQHIAILDRPLDLIITDIIMPGMSGVEMMKQLRGQGINAPVIYISGYDEMQIESIEPGATFLKKPFAIDALLKEINRSLNRAG